ncbi:methylase involved in ubiquinone/menaquinone biosynthesis [Desulfitobacterium dichloroeliminans LMG P-21439]|uniref:Methylase involved in ubiquinone/menaquinone biosynthesis n=1 Tax=Desulfitobacterium dichloroeliminans (strain LMG P-21439 / DCA1) TaxID=871963 RepID=L0F7K3_DESDL|nr:class I SAM-dependent methyltransferase [Desulfitobacterium dichloroeliminans]AGA68938.1 methylase involved in ubiquinone/menaquinone biosynthesis [Desulfitobacterium dichloroeliminans LMG P-21439]
MNHIHHHNPLDQKLLNKIAFLDSRQREQLIPPEALISQMPIQKNHTLLDVGAGSGFFTIPMAESTSGKVYAMDPDKRMLSVIQDKAKEKGLANIELIQDYIESLSIPNSSVDFVMASLILHEVSSLTKALTNIFEILKPGGHLLCLEYEKDDLIIEGPPMSIRIGSEELEKALSSIGFEIVKKTKINDAIYTVLAIKKEQ